MTTSDPTDAQLPEETPKREVPFDKEDLTFGPDDVVHNSDADPDRDPDRDSDQDPAQDTEQEDDGESGT